MAPPSPRRSSRARLPNSQSQQSSGSSSTSGRPDRSSRALNKPSSGKSTPSASLSSEPPEDADDTLLSRRRTRGQDVEAAAAPQGDTIEMANGSEELQDEEDEAVRCLCGSEDYPGRPPVEGPDASLFDAIDFTEDVIGFFVQCDICKVWQHGACAGIFSAESSPDEYFCEQCRKDLHKISTATNGQKYSKYLPLHRGSQNPSRANSVAKDGARSPKPGGSKNQSQAATLASGKRRSTMNSRDAAYDDEQLRRAIEASKEENVQETIEGSTRRPKRGRSDSDENVPNVKRQRTGSRSVTPTEKPPEDPSRDESEDDTRNDSRRSRNARSQREKTEKEEKDRQRQDAASKRKSRAERRRGEEESDPSDEIPLSATRAAAKKSVEPPAATESSETPQQTPGTPPTQTVGSSHKRGARSHHKRGKGRNQYTKDRDLDNEESPARSMSRDIQKNADEPAAAGGSSKSSTTEHKSNSRSKASGPGKMSMLDMKRRVAAIMDFISRTQVDLAAEATPSHSGQSSAKGSGTPVDGEADKAIDADRQSLNLALATDGKEFKDLNCMEMMDVLTRDMVKWQSQYV